VALDWPAFGDALWKVNNQLGIRPEWVLPVIYLETAKTFDPSIVNRIGCVGLNQFCGTTYAHYVSVPVEQYRTWTASEQLSGPIFEYWKDALRSGPIDSAARLMVAQLSHSALSRATSPSSIIFAAPSAEYEGNKGTFDPGGKGYFTLADVAGVLGYLSRALPVQEAVNTAYNMRDQVRVPVSSGFGALGWAGAFALAAGAAYGAHKLRSRPAWTR